MGSDLRHGSLSWAGVLIASAAVLPVNGADSTPESTGSSVTATETTVAGQVQTNPPGSALAGKELFTGAIRFQNGGPACIACHSIGGVAFPNGGTLGPDLTAAFTKLGSEGLDVAMETLYFPSMVAIFNARPLTGQEQQDLKAFFTQAQSLAPPRDDTPVLVGIALVGCLGLLALTRLWGGHRPAPVRRSLVKGRSPPEELSR